MARKSAPQLSKPGKTSGPPMFSNQITSVRFLGKKERALDLSDPGTGKTRTQIEVFTYRRSRGYGCALVLAPKSLLRSAWQEDFAKFAPQIVTVVAPAEKRAERFAEHADVYITNTDAVVWLAKQPAKFFAKFDTLIIDEISSFKHHTSQRSRALNKIKKYFRFRYGLSGTPNANTITDIWHPTFVIDDGHRLGKSFFHFRASVCQPEQVGPQTNMLKWTDKPGAEMAVSGLLSDIVIRHKLEDCISIPQNHEFSVPYFMTPAQTKAYKEMEKGAIATLASGNTISALNAAGVMTKLLQIASGASYSDTTPGGYATISNDRYELAADIVEQRQNTVVFFNWRHQRDLLIKEFEKRGITYVVVDGSTSDKDRKNAVDMFQAGFYRVFLAHPQSAAHGLTLTRGTTTLWVSPSYNLEHVLQGNRRTYRAGQTQKTETITLIAQGTIETTVYAKMLDKSLRQATMLDLLKEAFNAVP